LEVRKKDDSENEIGVFIKNIMQISTQLRLKLSAILLLTVLLMPSTLQLLHSFENHKHTACGEVTTHLHERTVDCSIDCFHFSAFTFKTLPFFNQVISEAFSKNQIGYFSSEIIGFQSHIFLRGPPPIS
jgi:hypothetical protein